MLPVSMPVSACITGPRSPCWDVALPASDWPPEADAAPFRAMRYMETVSDKYAQLGLDGS